MVGALLPYVNDTMSELSDLTAGDTVELLKETGALSPEDDETIIGTVSDICEPDTIEWADHDRDDEIVIVETEDGEEREISTNNGQISVVSVEHDDQNEDDDAEIVTDGGEDVTEHVSDETIETTIKQHDDPDHPDAVTVDEVRDLLAFLQRGAEAAFGVYMDHVEDGDATIVHEDSDVIVLATGEQNWASEELGEYDGDVDDITTTVVTQVMHELAGDRCDYDWSYQYPFVIHKPDGFDAGQHYVEAVVNGLQKRGLSPGQAWAYYGVEVRGNSMKSWGTRKGDHDHKNVSDALEKARQKLPEAN